MKAIDLTQSSDRSETSARVSKLITSIRRGLPGSRNMRAQEAIVTALERILDNRFFLLRGVRIPNLEAVIPLLLVGPAGVRVLYPCGLGGLFRVRIDTWEMMDENQKRYRPMKPNILDLVSKMARSVLEFLVSQGTDISEVDAAVVFTHPGTHVELVRPSVKIILADGLDRMASGMLQVTPIYEKDDIQQIVSQISASTLPTDPSRARSKERDAFSYMDERREPQIEDLTDKIPRGEGLVRLVNKIPLNSRQWLVISLLIIVNLIILIAFVLFVLFTPV